MATDVLHSEIYDRLYAQTLRSNDILPVGTWETIPVEVTNTSLQYPEVVRLNLKFDTERLTEDFRIARPKLLGARDLFETRDANFVSTDWDEIFRMLIELGFTKDSYAAYSLRKYGTNELYDCIQPYTREAFGRIGPNFRQLYVVAQPGWCCKPHIDNENMPLHGFKIHLPLNTDGHIGYVRKNGEIAVYRMEKGVPYFCNTAVVHFGLNPLPQERYTAIFQLGTDVPLMQGQAQEPLTHSTEIERCIPWVQTLRQERA